MSDDTTQQPTYTPAQILAAKTEYDANYQKLEACPEPEGGATRTALLKRQHELSPIAFYAAPAVKTGPTWQERRAFRERDAELRREADQYEQGSPIREEIFRDVAEHAAEFHKDDPVPGRMTWEDVSRARSAEAWSADEKQTLVLAAKAVGADPIAAMQFQSAWEEHRQHDWSQEPDRDFRAIWGADFSAKRAAYARVAAAIPTDLWNQLIDAGLEKNVRLVELLVAHGSRSAS